jgi:L-amino acid N-acyltransferase YncA
MVEHTIREARDADRRQIVDVFNYHVRNSFAAYPDTEAGLGFVDALRNMAKGFPFLVIEVDQRVVGFGLMRRYHNYETFKRTGLLTYFLLPEYTGLGWGSELLDRLIREAVARGMDNLLASISSRNEQSLAFHKKHGFVECGRLRDVGVKFGKSFDVVWMQKRVEQTRLARSVTCASS